MDEILPNEVRQNGFSKWYAQRRHHQHGKNGEVNQNEEDEISVERQRTSWTCPITGKLLENPVKKSVCIVKNFV